MSTLSEEESRGGDSGVVATSRRGTGTGLGLAPRLGLALGLGLELLAPGLGLAPGFGLELELELGDVVVVDGPVGVGLVTVTVVPAG